MSRAPLILRGEPDLHGAPRSAAPADGGYLGGVGIPSGLWPKRGSRAQAFRGVAQESRSTGATSVRRTNLAGAGAAARHSGSRVWSAASDEDNADHLAFPHRGARLVPHLPLTSAQLPTFVLHHSTELLTLVLGPCLTHALRTMLHLISFSQYLIRHRQLSIL